MPPCRAPATRTVARHPLDTAGHKVSAARLRRTLAGCLLAWSFFFTRQRFDLCLFIVELGLECTQLVVCLLGLESPLLAALGEVGHLVLELLEGGLEGLMLALPKVPALAVEPNQRARSAPAVLGCPLWSPSRRLAGKGSVHACLLLPHPWEHPKLAPAQQKKQNLARSNWQSRSTFHGASLSHPRAGCSRFPVPVPRGPRRWLRSC